MYLFTLLYYIVYNADRFFDFMSTSNSCCVHVAENVKQRPLGSHCGGSHCSGSHCGGSQRPLGSHCGASPRVSVWCPLGAVMGRADLHWKHVTSNLFQPLCCPLLPCWTPPESLQHNQRVFLTHSQRETTTRHNEICNIHNCKILHL